MFPEKIGDAKFEALLKCEQCGWDGRALYRKPVRPDSEFHQNVVWDGYDKIWIEGETSVCPNCGGQLVRSL